MLAIVSMVPILTIFYTFLVIKQFGDRNYGKLFAISFPFILWMTMRASQDGAAQMKSFWSLLKMLFLSNIAKKKLIEHRKNCQSLIKNVVNEYKINIDDKIIDQFDKETSQSIGTINYRDNYQKNNNKLIWILWRLIRRLYYGRVKNDWNETIRLYDVPVDEFHLSDKHEEQLQLGYTYT